MELRRKKGSVVQNHRMSQPEDVIWNWGSRTDESDEIAMYGQIQLGMGTIVLGLATTSVPLPFAWTLSWT